MDAQARVYGPDELNPQDLQAFDKLERVEAQRLRERWLQTRAAIVAIALFSLGLMLFELIRNAILRRADQVMIGRQRTRKWAQTLRAEQASRQSDFSEALSHLSRQKF